MTRPRCVVQAALSAALALACSAGGDGSLVVGTQTGGAASVPNGSGGALGFGGNVSGPSAFSAHVESPRGVVVEFVTLSCANACADVLAVAVGGYEPYTFAWEDGSTSAARRVCPSETTRYEVTVTDAGTSGEIPRPPRTVSTGTTGGRPRSGRRSSRSPRSIPSRRFRWAGHTAVSAIRMPRSGSTR